jgi:hypothetical protein
VCAKDVIDACICGQYKLKSFFFDKKSGKVVLCSKDAKGGMPGPVQQNHSQE